MGYYGQGNQFPLMPNPNWKSVREQMLQHQLLQVRQQFEAWRASQTQLQPQPPISFSGLPIKVENDVEIFSVRSASAKRGLDLKTRLGLKPLNVPGLLQHLADPSLPDGTTLEGLAQPQGHLKPVLNRLRTDLLLPRT